MYIRVYNQGAARIERHAHATKEWPARMRDTIIITAGHLKMMETIDFFCLNNLDKWTEGVLRQLQGECFYEVLG